LFSFKNSINIPLDKRNLVLKSLPIKIRDQNLILDPLKAIFWEDQQILILSDIHFGKAGHFRKSGIPIPNNIHHDDIKNLRRLIRLYSPKRTIIVGDLFHSQLNQEWHDLRDFFLLEKDVDFILVKGNHDILDVQNYHPVLHCVDEFQLGPFYFTHEPRDFSPSLYNISGHIHPSISVNGKGRQNLRLSCFYFSENCAVLPSFGNFTGYYRISVKFGDLIYLIVDEQVIPYNSFMC